jgi:hypothetical protein
MKYKLQYLKAKWSVIRRFLLWTAVAIAVLLFSLFCLINIPAVQTYLAGKIVSSIREKTGTLISLGTVKVSLPNTVHINDVNIQDQKADTLLYLHSLRAHIDLFKLLRNQVNITSLDLENLVTHINRKNQGGAFNFQFLIDAFTPAEPLKSDTTVKRGPPLSINLKDISLKDMHAVFSDGQSGIHAVADLGSFEASFKAFDPAKKICSIDNISFKNSSVKASLAKSTDKEEVQTAKTDSLTHQKSKPGRNAATDYFPGWNVSVDKFNMENASLRYDDNSFPKSPEGFDYRHLAVNNLKTGIRSISLSPDGISAKITGLNFTEGCGFNLKKFAVDLKLTNQLAELQDFQIETAASEISADAGVNYASVDKLLNDPWNCELRLDVRNISVDANELIMLVPALNDNRIAGRFRNSKVSVTTKAEGKINDLNLQNLEVSLLKNSVLKAHGRLTGLPDLPKLGFDATVDLLSSGLTDLYKLTDPSVFAGLKLPESFKLTGTAAGKLNAFKADAQLITAYGNIDAKGFYENSGSAGRDSFYIGFTAKDILAGVIVGDSLLGKMTLSGNAGGKGITSGPLSGSASIDVQEAQFNAYTYTDIKITGRIDKNLVSATAGSRDPNLSFDLTANADLNKPEQKFNAGLDLSMLNLRALNFTQKDIAISTRLAAELNYGGLDHSKANLSLTDTRLIGKETTAAVKNLNINAVSLPDSLYIRFNSDFADGTMGSNIKPENLVKTLQTAFQKYFDSNDTIRVMQGKQLDLLMDVHAPPDIISFFDPEFQSGIMGKFEGAYKSDNNDLSVKMHVPEAKYSNIRLDSLGMIMTGRNEKLSMDLRLANISYDKFFIENIRIKEQVEKRKILSEINIIDSLGTPKYMFANEILRGDSSFKVRFLPKGLILDGVPWSVDAANFLEKNKNELSAQKFVFTNDRQSIGFFADEESRKLVFTNFSLRNLLDIVEFQGNKLQIKGNLNGEIAVPSSGNLKFINANLGITPISILNKDVGNLVIKIKTANDRMDIDTKFENEKNIIGLNGVADHLSGTPLLDMNVLINITDVHSLEQYTSGYVSELGGKINGEISLKGNANKPEIDGYLGFEGTAFKINSLNFLARIKQEKIQINSKGIHFDDFVIEDARAKTLTVNGDINTDNYKDFRYDLHFVSKDFQPINSTVEDNPLFYGKLSLDADVKIKGEMKTPKIEASLNINPATDLTYAMPGSELKLVSAEGVVQFLDAAQSPDSVIVAKKSESLSDSIIASLSGINYAVNLEIDPEAKFKVDIDPKSGDYLTIGGGAKLNITGDGAGNQSITGIYVVKNGVYQVSFYGLVKKSFTIAPGSTVTWSGSPKDAEVNITAGYVVRTSSVALVANETTGMSDAEKTIFNQRLPYEVKLNIRGFLSKPEISFNINLPDKYLVANPIIANKLALLNTEEMASELNKQVFALLVTGSFLTSSPMTTGGSSTTNIASTAARNSVNSILADQLNNVSNKYISGVDVNFGLTSYEDYTQSSGDVRTELAVQFSKKLFNDRLKIEAQGAYDLKTDNSKNKGSSNDYMNGEFAIIYSLTKNGEYKLKTYHQNTYDYFYGEIAYSGIALIFEKEFDTLKSQKKQKEDGKKSKQ